MITHTKINSKPTKFIPPRSFTSLRYPKFIRQHPVLKQNPKIQKIFPLIGLKNQSLPLIQFLLEKKEKELFANKNYQIMFSSDPWDISTMSMRGVKSCQRWGSTHASHLIGSILDPCCAIIYLTDGSKTNKGSKILVRSVVRFVLDQATRKRKYVVIDEPYFEEQFQAKFDSILSSRKKFQEIFAKALKQMLITGNDISIKLLHRQDNYRCQKTLCIPYSPTNQAFIGPSKYSYRDALIPYWFVKPERLPKIAQKIGWGDGSEESCEMNEDI